MIEQKYKKMSTIVNFDFSNFQGNRTGIATMNIIQTDENFTIMHAV